MEKEEKNVRQLTISRLYVPHNSWNSRFVPFIRICGIWLKECGFEQGQKVTVKIEQGRLTIE